MIYYNCRKGKIMKQKNNKITDTKTRQLFLAFDFELALIKVGLKGYYKGGVK